MSLSRKNKRVDDFLKMIEEEKDENMLLFYMLIDGFRDIKYLARWKRFRVATYLLEKNGNKDS